MSIKELIKKQSFLMGLSIFLLVLLSFGLGYLAGLNFDHAPIIIEKASL